MSLTPLQRQAMLEQARDNISDVLADHLPAGDGDVKPAPSWDGWRMAFALIHARYELNTILRDLTHEAQSTAT